MILDLSLTWGTPAPHLTGLVAIEHMLLVAPSKWKFGELGALLGFENDGTPPRFERRGKVVVVPILGLLTPRFQAFGRIISSKADRARTAIRQLSNDPDVEAVVLDIDSPGGSTAGIEELADEIYAARSKKRIIASVNSLAASAAYWLASSAHEISLTPSGHVGSIGVLGVHMDVSRRSEQEGIAVTVVTAGKYKAEASEFTPLSRSAHRHLQRLINDRYHAFVKAVARGRSTSQKAVRNGFGEGRLVHAKDALAMKMVDRVEDQTTTLERVSGIKRPQGRLSAWGQAQQERMAIAAELKHLEQIAAVRDEMFAGRMRAYDPEAALAELRELEASR